MINLIFGIIIGVFVGAVTMFAWQKGIYKELGGK